MSVHQSTPEEIAERRAEIEAAECPGDGVHAELRSSHDWRLWERKPWYDSGQASEFGTWPLGGHNETWYCTRCRRIEERRV